ncbi:MAG: CPBP family intramembrane glutamic endopeptidase [Oscillospiraceae bacterium]|jgi:membrane protease YdiL (CAAX protease family)
MFHDREPFPWEEPLPFPPPINPWKGVLRTNSNIIFGALLLLLALMAGAPFFILLLGQWFPVLEGMLYALPSFVLGMVEMVLSIFMLLAPCLLMVFFLNMPTAVAFPKKPLKLRLLIPGIFCCLGMSAVGVMLSGYLQALLASTLGVIPVMPDQPPPYGLPEAILYFLQVALVPAVFEEMVFRGVVLQSLRRFGDGFALAVSSILFACAHGNLVQAPNAMLTGMVLGYFALRSGSLLTPMLMHFINNGIAALVNLGMLYLPAAFYQLLNNLILPIYLVLGVLGVGMMFVFNEGFVPLFSTETGMGSGEKFGRFFTTPLAVLYLLLTLYVTALNFARI